MLFLYFLAACEGRGSGACPPPPTLDFFFKYCQMKNGVILTLHILMGCSVPFPVLWYHFHGGRGGAPPASPPDFIFNFCKILKGVFSHYTFSSPVVSCGSEGRGGVWGHAPPDFIFIFCKIKKRCFLTLHVPMGCTVPFPVVSFSCGGLGAAGGGVWGMPPPGFYF